MEAIRMTLSPAQCHHLQPFHRLLQQILHLRLVSRINIASGVYNLDIHGEES